MLNIQMIIIRHTRVFQVMKGTIIIMAMNNDLCVMVHEKSLLAIHDSPSCRFFAFVICRNTRALQLHNFPLSLGPSEEVRHLWEDLLDLLGPPSDPLLA